MQLIFDGRPLPEGVRFDVHLVPERRVFLRSDPRDGARLRAFASLATAYHMAQADVNHVREARVVDAAGATLMELEVVAVEYRLESHLEQVALDVISVRLPEEG